jgi:hypothetical protein
MIINFYNKNAKVFAFFFLGYILTSSLADFPPFTSSFSMHFQLGQDNQAIRINCNPAKGYKSKSQGSSLQVVPHLQF